MRKFVIDEDMPRSTAAALIEEGYAVKDVRDHGYRGSGDAKIYSFAQDEEAILLTGDLGFGNILKFPLGHHFGIVVARFPNEMRPREINKEILDGLRDLRNSDFKGNLRILERGRIRIRRAPVRPTNSGL
jgi:predicted nuclease of predicted toxin-antitoxin system